MLSKRLEAVAQLVPNGARVADIGCDHAYLPIELVKCGRVAYAIGCDVNKGPLEAAAKNAKRFCLDETKLALRLGDGLHALQAGEVDTVTIAGMGAGLMKDILTACPEVVASLKRIIVSPNVAPWILRAWAMQNGFAVCDETVVYENNHYYEVFSLVPTDEVVRYSDAECYFGLALPKQCDNITRAYFEARRGGDVRLLAAWEKVRTHREDVALQYDRLTALWQEWEAMNPCK